MISGNRISCRWWATWWWWEIRGSISPAWSLWRWWWSMIMMMIKNSIDDENRKEVPDMHAWLLNWVHDSWFQVTIDPTTLAPTDQLDPRALAWIESLGVKPKQTVQVIFLYFLCPSSRNQLMMTIFIDCKRKTFELIPKSRRPSSFNSDDSLSSTRTNWIFLLNRERKDWPSR